MFTGVFLFDLLLPRTCRASGGKMIGAGVHICDCIRNKTLGRAQDPHANGAWLSKLTE